MAVLNGKKLMTNLELEIVLFIIQKIYVDPQNENKLYTVFTYINVSKDGGESFKQLMPAYGVDNGVHPDHHAWWIHPTNGKFMIDGNDGGLNITKDGGKTWRFIGNIPVAQFYHINVDNEFPYNVYGRNARQWFLERPCICLEKSRNSKFILARNKLWGWF